MKKLFIASSIAFALIVGSSNTAFAEEQEQTIQQAQKNEMIGFGSGAIAGATVGGPIGGIIGGVLGIFIANDINNDDKLKQQGVQLSQLNSELLSKQDHLALLQKEYKNLQHKQMLQLVAYEEQDNSAWLNDFSHFETNLQFKTASYLIEDTYKSQLNSLAALLSEYPQLSVKVTGFADHRGDSEYNKSLSLQRADAVKTYLLKNKVKNTQISVLGAGETPLTNDLITSTEPAFGEKARLTGLNIEDLFFERRVTVTLINTDKQLSAAN